MSQAQDFALQTSFAVLPFEPHTTMPPSNAATAAGIAAGSNRIAQRRITARTMPPPAMAVPGREQHWHALLLPGGSNSDQACYLCSLSYLLSEEWISAM
jgi:hypothetical protein